MNKQRTSCKGIKTLALGILLTNSMAVFTHQEAAARTNATVATEQKDMVTISVKNQSIRNVLAIIAKQTGYALSYNANLAGMDRLVNINIRNASLNAAMQSVLLGTGLTYEINSKQILVFAKKDKIQSQSAIKATGVVLDDIGNPMIGVTVKGSDGKTLAVTDFDGRFNVETTSGEKLQFSYIGFKNQEMKATPQMKIIMNEDKEKLEEVVVVGYGTMKKSDLTGSVSGLGEKDFNKGMMASPTQMLQGRTTGVNITNNGGEPGSGVSVRVRGSNSIRSGQEPLYVVDGVPLNISDAQQPSGVSVSGGGSTGSTNPISFINPDDIERIDVLKDASATAIYGSRGANGVIMITTKKGGEGAMKVSYSAMGTISWLPSQLDVLSADEFKSAAKQYGYTVEDKGSNTNWQDEIFRTSFSHNHNLSISGGNAKGSYRASLGYQDQQGIIKTSSMQKYNGHFYFSTNMLNDRLKLELNTTVSRIDQRRVPIGESGGAEGDLIYNALRLNPTFPIKNDDGTYFQYSNANRNPVAMLNLTNDNTQTDRVMANATATLKLLKGLNYKFNIAFDEMKASRKVEQNEQLIYLDDGGVFVTSNVEAHNMLIENYFTYNLQLDGGHKFDALLGHSYQRTKDYVYGYNESGFYIDDVSYKYDLALSTKKDQISGTSDVTVNELQSFFGRINYNYLDRYLLTANMRIDGSSKFGENNRYGVFPSTAVAWRMSEEPFIKKLNIFDNLKLRGSWGLTGNQEIPSKISHMLLSSTGKSTIFGIDGATVPGITLTRTPNPDLKWERTSQIDFGLDFGLLGGRLWGSIDYYNKVTKDVLMQIPSASPAPTTYVWRNIEDMKIKNHGFEFSLNGRIIDRKKLRWDMGFNLSTINNKVEDLPVESLPIGRPSGPGLDGLTAQVIKSGYPIGTFWGRVFEGFDADGKSIFKKDADGKEVEENIGCAQPDLTANLTSTVVWGDFDLTVNFNGVFGNDVYNNLANVIDNRAWLSAGSNALSSAVHNTSEALTNPMEYSSRYIEDGSYIRLSNLSLGYNVPLKSNKYINGLYVYMNATNLFCISDYSGYDPEVNASRSTDGVPTLGFGWTQYPAARTFSFGMKFEF